MHMISPTLNRGCSLVISYFFESPKISTLVMAGFGQAIPGSSLRQHGLRPPSIMKIRVGR
jgi:hypothetical protein